MLFKAYDTSAEIGAERSIAGDIFETKFAVPRRLRNIVLATLRHNAREPDRFACASIKTTYFDDDAGTSLSESLDGDIDKRKYRLREYVDATEGADYSIEIKARSDTVTAKLRRLIFTRLSPGYGFTTFSALIETFERLGAISLAELKVELPGRELYPSAVLRYERQRFDDRRTEARYNLDTNVTVSFGALGRADGHGYPLEHDLFEIKSPHPEFFPAFLGDMELEPLSFSKFLWGKEALE